MKPSARAAWLALAATALGSTAHRLATAPYCPTFDDSWYLENSFRFLHALKQSPLRFAQEYTASFRIKAPLVSVLPLPLYAAFGTSEKVGQWSIFLAWLAAAIGVHKLARRLFSADAAACATALYLCAPLSFGLSRLFFVEALLAALVVWTLAETLEDRPSATRLGALAGLGLLAKSLFPLYVALPLWIERERLLPRAKRAAALAAAVAATWYAFNLPYVVGFGLSAGFGSVARDYAPGTALSPSVLLGYASALLRDGLSWPLAAIGAGIVLLAPAGERRARTVLLAATAPLLVFFVGVNKDLRYAAPLVPIFALAVGGAWSRLGGLKRAALGCALATASLWALATRTWELPLAVHGPYNAPPRACSFDRDALIDALARSATPASVVAVALEHPEMNANSLAARAAARGLTWRTTSLGYAQTSVEAALLRLKDKDVDHLVLFEGVPEDELSGFLNRANAGVAGAIDSGRLKSVGLARVAVAPGVSARVLRLVR